MVPREAKLLELLSNNDVTFFIPPYQRNYEWTDEQCKVFLEDILKTYEENKVEGNQKQHFFGTVTYFKSESVFGQPSKLVLIDGQQRITTTMIFLIAMRNILKEDGIKDFINQKYLKNNNVSGDTEYKIKLKQVETDWDSYKHLVLDEEIEDEDKRTAVYRNYSYFCNKLTECIDQGYDLLPVIEKGLNEFSVVTIELQPDKNPWENPQEIFESMNSLGKPLSLADLVRNYLLLGLNADLQDTLYKKYWLHIERAVPQNVSTFIRDYMQAVDKKPYKQASENNYKELYSQFKASFAGSDPDSLLSNLSELSTLYSFIALGRTTGNKSIDGVLADLRRVQITTAYSFIMMLLVEWKGNSLSDKDLLDILTVFKIYILRRRIAIFKTAENKIFPTLVSRIPELVAAENKKEKMFEILASQENNLRLPNDIEMTRILESMNFYNFRYCKFFLALIEEDITKSRPDLSDVTLQVEHIMPQTLNDIWQEELGEDHERIHLEYLNTIGNLTLIRHNQELGNRRFSSKKELYTNKAGLQIAKTKITDCEHWSEPEIKSRSEWIINYLLTKVIPIPESMRRVNNFLIKERKGKTKHLSFLELQLIGEDIQFAEDPSIVAHVIDDKHVEFEGKKWKLSPLTRELKERNGTVNNSGAYQGAQYWEYDGIRLADIM